MVEPEVGAQCSSSARWDLCGGRAEPHELRPVPTATVSSQGEHVSSGSGVRMTGRVPGVHPEIPANSSYPHYRPGVLSSFVKHGYIDSISARICSAGGIGTNAEVARAEALTSNHREAISLQ